MLASYTPRPRWRSVASRGVVGKRANDLAAVLGKELGQVPLPLLTLDGEVVAHQHAAPQLAGAYHQVPEAGVDLGGPAGDVHRPETGVACEHVEARLHHVVGHHLRARWRRVDVAVVARLVAALPDVHLEGVDLLGAQLSGPLRQSRGEAVVGRASPGRRGGRPGPLTSTPSCRCCGPGGRGPERSRP